MLSVVCYEFFVACCLCVVDCSLEDVNGMLYGVGCCLMAVCCRVLCVVLSSFFGSCSLRFVIYSLFGVVCSL